MIIFELPVSRVPVALVLSLEVKFDSATSRAVLNHLHFQLFRRSTALQSTYIDPAATTDQTGKMAVESKQAADPETVKLPASLDKLVADIDSSLHFLASTGESALAGSALQATKDIFELGMFHDWGT